MVFSYREKDTLIEATGLRLYFVLDAQEKPMESELWQNAMLDHIYKKVNFHSQIRKVKFLSEKSEKSIFSQIFQP